MKQGFFSFMLMLFSWVTVLAQTVKLDPAFGVNGISLLGFGQINNFGDAMAYQPDGSLILACTRNGQVALKKVFENGQLDSTFLLSQQHNPFLIGEYLSVLILQNGKIICTDGSNSLYRFHSDGQLDSTFGIYGQKDVPPGRITKLYELPDGKIVATGYFSASMGIMRLNSDGNLDSTFAENGLFSHWHGGITLSFDMNIQADGKYLLGGCAVNTTPQNLVVRVDTEGKLDSTFGLNGAVYYSNITDAEGFCQDLQSDGKIVLGGYEKDPITYYGTITRYLSNGTLDPDFGENGKVLLQEIKTVYDVKVLDDQKIMVSGYTGGNAQEFPAFARVLTDGTPDSTFGINGIFRGPTTLASQAFAFEQTGSHEFVTYALKPNQEIALFKILTDLSVGTITPKPDLNVLIYPNPIVESCTLKFKLEQPSSLSFQLMDTQGRMLETLVNQELFPSGEQEKTLRIPEALPKGTYQLLITIDEKIVKAVTIIKA